MAEKSFARRYAQAVFEIALETKELDQWQANLEKVTGKLGEPAFASFLGSPKFRFDEKDNLLSQQMKGINPLVLNLVRLLITRSRLELIGSITDEYQRLLDSYRGIERAELITAVPIDSKHEQKLAEYLGKMIGKKVIPESKIDRRLIGGIIARVGGKLLDGSTRSKMTSLKRGISGMGR
ncbi:ATP synthase F1 subunit delta [Chloroflexota bacterium]